MKITKSQLKQIIKEELETITEMGPKKGSFDLTKGMDVDKFWHKKGEPTGLDPEADAPKKPWDALFRPKKEELEEIDKGEYAYPPDDPSLDITPAERVAQSLAVDADLLITVLEQEGLQIVSAEEAAPEMTPEEEVEYERAAKASEYYDLGERPSWQKDRPQRPGRGKSLEEKRKKK